MPSDVPGASFTGFPLPPPHWQLFRESKDSKGSKVLVAPPRIPAGEIFVFGERCERCERQLEDSRQPLPQLDAEEWLCNPEASDLGAELLNLHGMLQTSSLELLDCLAQNPSEYPTHLRRLNHVTKNLQALLYVLQQREAKATVLQKLREQVSRKRAFLKEARESLPNLRQRLEDIGLQPGRT